MPTGKRNASVDDEDERFYVCMGIDYGRYLRLADDVFGDAVNLADKLGENLAGRVPLAVYRLEW